MLLCKLLTRSRGLWAVLAIAGLVLCSGCAPGGYSGPTGTVTGTVTLNGEPVPQGCTVAFVSDAGHTASGQIGAGGAYQLSVVGKEGSKTSDVPVATYKVSVSPPAGDEMSAAEYEKMMEEESAAAGEPKAEAPAEAEVIPAKYQSSGTSELSFEVKEGSNTIDIPLE